MANILVADKQTSRRSVQAIMYNVGNGQSMSNSKSMNNSKSMSNSKSMGKSKSKSMSSSQSVGNSKSMSSGPSVNSNQSLLQMTPRMPMRHRYLTQLLSLSFVDCDKQNHTLQTPHYSTRTHENRKDSKRKDSKRKDSKRRRTYRTRQDRRIANTVDCALCPLRSTQ